MHVFKQNYIIIEFRPLKISVIINKQGKNMNWNAFNGLTQFFATIATFLAVVVALYQSRSQFKTRVKLSIRPSVVRKQGGVKFISLVLRVTNVSNHDVYLKDIFLFVSKNTMRYSGLNSEQRTTLQMRPRIYAEFHFDMWALFEEMEKTKKYRIKATVETQDGTIETISFPFAKRLLRIHQEYEDNNLKAQPGYEEFKEKIRADFEKGYQAQIDAYNEENNILLKESVIEQISIWSKFACLRVLAFLASLKMLWIILGIITFSVVFFFTIVGIIYVFHL